MLTASSGDGSGLSPGGFQFTGIAFGTYTVTANKPGSSAISSVQAVVADASVPVNVSLVLPGSGRVTVTVLDVDGTPIPNLQVLRASGCAGIPATTGSDPSDPATFGVAVFEDVRIGNVHVKAVRGADLASASAVIRRDDDEAALVLRFAGFGTVTGAVIGPGGRSGARRTRRSRVSATGTVAMPVHQRRCGAASANRRGRIVPLQQRFGGRHHDFGLDGLLPGGDDGAGCAARRR